MDERSAPRTDLYLTTHNTHLETFMPLAGIERATPASERPRVPAILISIDILMLPNGSQRVLRGSQVNRDQYPRKTWIRFSNGNFEVYIFVYDMNKVLLKIIAERL